MTDPDLMTSSTKEVFIALGSNISPEIHLNNAVELLCLHEHLNVVQVSSVWESAPVGFLEQPAFCNAAVQVQTLYSPVQLKSELLKIEDQLGRVRDPNNKNGPRTIDLDISLFGVRVLDGPNLVIPDPEIQFRPFLALPLAELSPDFIHPILLQKLVRIADTFGDDHGMRIRSDIRLLPLEQ